MQYWKKKGGRGQKRKRVMPREGNPVTEKGEAENKRKGTALAERESYAIANRINDCFLFGSDEMQNASFVTFLTPCPTVEALCHYGLRYRPYYHNITRSVVDLLRLHFSSSLLNDTDINYSRSRKAFPDAFRMPFRCNSPAIWHRLFLK